MKASTLFDKIWSNHVVKTIEGGPDVLFIDRQYMHEVTSPAAFEGIRRRGIKPLMPERITAICDQCKIRCQKRRFRHWNATLRISTFLFLVSNTLTTAFCTWWVPNLD